MWGEISSAWVMRSLQKGDEKELKGRAQVEKGPQCERQVTMDITPHLLGGVKKGLVILGDFIHTEILIVYKLSPCECLYEIICGH